MDEIDVISNGVKKVCDKKKFELELKKKFALFDLILQNVKPKTKVEFLKSLQWFTRLAQIVKHKNIF